jgi:hypothetical protein
MISGSANIHLASRTFADFPGEVAYVLFQPSGLLMRPFPSFYTVHLVFQIKVQYPVMADLVEPGARVVLTRMGFDRINPFALAVLGYIPSPCLIASRSPVRLTSFSWISAFRGYSLP